MELIVVIVKEILRTKEHFIIAVIYARQRSGRAGRTQNGVSFNEVVYSFIYFKALIHTIYKLIRRWCLDTVFVNNSNGRVVFHICNIGSVCTRLRCILSFVSVWLDWVGPEPIFFAKRLLTATLLVIDDDADKACSETLDCNFSGKHFSSTMSIDVTWSLFRTWFLSLMLFLLSLRWKGSLPETSSEPFSSVQGAVREGLGSEWAWRSDVPIIF